MEVQIPLFESFNCEFKREWAKEPVRKVLVSFANTLGGTLYIGVNDDGTVAGLDDIDAVGQSLASVISDSIYPPMTDCVSMVPFRKDGKDVLVVRVDQGRFRPYSLRNNDPSGVLVRVGNTSQPASLNAIAQIFRDSNPVPFESRVASEQELTFAYTQNVLAAHQIRIELKSQLDWGFVERFSKRWTNAAWLFSDQCNKGVRLLVFADDEETQLLRTELLTGSVFELVDKTLDWLAPYNLARMEKPENGSAVRKDHFFVEPAVLREAVVNLAAHRDYSREAPAVITVMPSCIRLMSPGGVSDGFSLEDIVSMDVTVCRNKQLAQIFCRVHYMESSGTGFRLVRSAYPQAPLEDLISVTSGAFQIRLEKKAASVPDKALSDEENQVLRLFDREELVRRSDVERWLKKPRASAAALLQKLVAAGVIETVGGGRSTAYRLKPRVL